MEVPKEEIMGKQWRLVLRNDLVLIFLGSIVGLGALILVHFLPTEPMREHVYWSLDMIEKEFEDELLVTGYPATLTGNFTDCLMLEHAIYHSEDHSVLEQATHMYRGESYVGEEDGWQPGRSLSDYLGGDTQPREVEYGRYWHGYLVILKPLLLLTSFNSIRLFNSALQLFMVGCVVAGLCKKNAYNLATGFLLSLSFLFFLSSYASLSLSICLYLMLALLLIQLRWDSKLCEKRWYGYFFLLSGMATSYFDFLTYPLVTLVFPLCAYLYLHDDDLGAKSSVFRMFGYSARWLEGYIGLWAMKWILTDVLTGSSVIRDAVATLKTRTGSADGYSRIGGFFSVVWKNIQPYNNWGYVLIAGIGFALLAGGMVRYGVKWQNWAKTVPYIFLALYPFGWFFVTQNHSAGHWQFTCRIMACSAFAMYAGCLKIRGIPKECADVKKEDFKLVNTMQSYGNSIREICRKP